MHSFATLLEDQATIAASRIQPTGSLPPSPSSPRLPGFVIVGVFVLTWAVALTVWHFGKIEQKWDTAKAAAPD